MDEEIYTALIALQPNQLDEVIRVAGAPHHHFSSPLVPIATRANELLQWMGQAPDNRTNLIKALERIEKHASAARDSAVKDYLEALGSLCKTFPFSIAVGNPALLSELYVGQQVETLEQAKRQEPSSVGQSSKNIPDFECIEMDSDALKRHKHIMFVAGPGMGKTSLLYKLVNDAVLARHRGEDSEFIPAFVSARGMAQREGSLSVRLRAQVMSQLGPRLGKDIPQEFFEERLGAPTWLILLDGLDEVIEEKNSTDLVDAILLHIRNPASLYRFVITSRPTHFEGRFLEAGVTKYSLHAFDPQQVTIFAEKWFSRKPDAGSEDARMFLDQVAQSRINELAEIPLLLTMAAFVFERGRENRLPSSRATLYDRFASVLLNGDRMKETHKQFQVEWDKWFPGKGIAYIDRLFDERRALLEYVARRQHEQGSVSLSEEGRDFVRHIGLISTAVDEEWLRNQVSLLLLRSGLVFGRAGEETFLHPTFREFLVASAIAREIAPESKCAHELLTSWLEKGQREIVLFAIQLWSQNSKSVEELLRFALKRVQHGCILAGLAIAEGVSVTSELEEQIIAKLLEQTRRNIGRVEAFIIERSTGESPASVLGRLKGRPRIPSALHDIARDRSLAAFARDDAVAGLGRLEETARLSALLQESEL